MLGGGGGSPFLGNVGRHEENFPTDSYECLSEGFFSSAREDGLTPACYVCLTCLLGVTNRVGFSHSGLVGADLCKWDWDSLVVTNYVSQLSGFHEHWGSGLLSTNSL